MVGWYIYENWRRDPGGKAIIHRGECKFCNHGKGIHGEASGKNCMWHGPFDNRETAYQEANNLGRTRVDFCSFCAR